MKNRKSTVARRNMILDQLNSDGEVFVDQLSKTHGVSEVTIRNDLDQLEKKRLLIRARGGAMKYSEGVGLDFGISEKDKINLQEKNRIGQYASTLVQEGDIIIIDSGTTTAELARKLDKFSSLTVITNAINIAIILSKFQNINIIMPGGNMRMNSQSLVGPIAEKSLARIHVDRVFLGVDGVDPKDGIFTANMEEAYLNEQMINVANEVIVLTDSSKFNRRAFAHICSFGKISKIITDKGINSEDKIMIEEAGVEIVIV